MNNAQEEIRDFVIKQGFTYEGGEDGYFDIYSTNHLSVYIFTEDHSKNGTMNSSVEFGHCEEGYMRIDNPSIEQISTLIDLYKASYYVDMVVDALSPKELYLFRFKSIVLEHLKDFLNNQERKIK